MSALGVPADENQKNLIDKVAQYVAKNGEEFEKMMMNKQEGNPEYDFLRPGAYILITNCFIAIFHIYLSERCQTINGPLFSSF